MTIKRRFGRNQDRPIWRMYALRKLSVAALALCAMSCAAAAAPKDEELEPIISKNARPLSDDRARTATIFPDKLLFPPSAQDWLGEVQTGEILVSGHEDGFLRRVTSIENSADSVVVHTEAAALTDVVEQGSTSVSIDFANLEPTSFHQTPGLSPQAASGEPFSFEQNLAGRTIEAGDGISVHITKGFLSFHPSIDVGITIRGWGVDEARAIAKGTFSSDFQVEIEGALELHKTKEVTLWESPSLKVPLPPIGPVPIVCEGRLVIKAGFQLDAAGKISVTLGQGFSFDSSFGVRYTSDGGWNKVSSFDPQWMPEPPTLGADVQVQARGYLRSSLVLGFYGGSKIFGTGAQVDLSVIPGLRLSYSSSDPPPGWGLYGGLRVEATPALTVLHKDLLSSTITLYDQEKLLLPAEGSGDAPPVEAGDCADGIEDGLETSIDCGGACAMDCGIGYGCVADDDCSEGACISAECVPSSCVNGTQDADEDGVDCGGPCPACSGGSCQDSSDCFGSNCIDGVCEEPLSCGDGELNGNEVDVDCGGDCEPCYDGVPFNCYDGEWNGDEEQVDCGGSCSPCDGGGGGGSCDGTGDCNTCVACADQGACSPLLDACNVNADCIALWDCLSACAPGDDVCVNDCYASYPAGESDYIAYLSCLICNECFYDCEGAGQCQ